MFQNTRKRETRRAFPITGYVGANGGGKSAAMVWDTLPSLESGRPVLSTVRLLDYDDPRPCDGCEEEGHLRPVYGPPLIGDALAAYVQRVADAEGCDPSEVPDSAIPVRDSNGFPLREVIGSEVHRQAHPLYVPLREWQQLLDARSCDVLLDEVTGIASSRESQGMPAPVANKLVQLRRADVVVRWSAPAWARADKIIRECSQSVTYCRGFFSKTHRDEGGARLWSQRRLFKWSTYDAMAFEDFTAGKREDLSTEVTDWHWGPKSPAFVAYDTYDAVSTVGTVSDAGRCYRCGGRRPIPSCSCEDHAPTRRGRGGAEGASAEREHRSPSPATPGRRVRLADTP